MFKQLLLTVALLSSTYGAEIPMDIHKDSPRETTHMEFHGILSPNQSLSTTKRFFDRDGDPYNLEFTFTPCGSDGTKYALSILFDEGIVRRNNAQGAAIDSTTPMILHFNEAGLISEFDCGQPTRNTHPPLLYIDMKPAVKKWLEEPLLTHSFPITWSIGQRNLLEYDSGNELFPNQLISRNDGSGHTFTFSTTQNGKGCK